MTDTMNKMTEEGKDTVSEMTAASGQNEACEDDLADEGHDEDQDRDRLPVDRGWSWMVLLACVFGQLIAAGTYRTFGILFTEIQKRYNSSSSQTTLIGSLMNAMYGCASILVSTVGIRYLSSRQIVLMGGTVISLAYFLSAFAPSIEVLILSLGCMMGIGQGFITCPSLALLHRYFDKYRSAANTLTIAGGSIGALLFSFLLRICIDTYAFSANLVLLSGISLNILVSGCLLRPPSFYKKARDVDVDASSDDVTNDSDNDSNTAEYDISSESKNYKHSRRKSASACDISLLKRHASPLLARSVAARAVTGVRTRTVSEMCKLNNNNNSLETIGGGGSASKIGHHTSTSKLEEGILRGSNLGLYASGELAVSSMLSVALQNNIDRKKQVHKKSDPRFDDSNMDIRKKSNLRVDDAYLDAEMANENSVCKCCSCRTNTGFGVMKRLPFLCFLPCAWLIAPLSSVQVFLHPHAIDVGLSDTGSDRLISIISFTDIFAIVGWGMIADRQIIARYKLVSMAAGFLALLTFALPWVTEQSTFIAYSVCYGLFARVYSGLFPVVLLDFLGIDNLGSAMGIASLVQTVSSAVAQPIIGILRDSYGSYIPGLMLIATEVLLGALCLLLLPLAARCEKKLVNR